MQVSKKQHHKYQNYHKCSILFYEHKVYKMLLHSGLESDVIHSKHFILCQYVLNI